MKVLVFGGTSEGRKLSEALANDGVDVTLSVATGYGTKVSNAQCVPPFQSVSVTNRLNVTR